MNEAGEMFENAILHWRDAAGVGTALIPTTLNDKVMVLGVLQRIYARSPTCKTIIVTNNFSERQELIEFLTQQGDEENDAEFKKIIDDGHLKVFTLDFVLRGTYKATPFLCVLYRPESIPQCLIDYLIASRFKLVILNKLLKTPEDIVALYKICPLLDDFKHNEVEAVRLSTPVEEIQIGVDIPENSNARKDLDKANEYISTSLAIFGSFDIMQQARTGNIALNISSNQICAQIAQENGWNENLDMSIEFNVEIDRLYNPMNLKERASKTYEIIRNRSQLLSDYDGKLDAILKVIEDNPCKKILIINKRGDFATRVTQYINCCSMSPICGNYHDRVEPIPAVDVNGLPLYYKSGAKKGERRMMAAQAQKTYNEHMFNQDKLRVLSTNNAPDKELAVDVDIVIITSPQCESIKSYMYRMSNLSFRSGNIVLYSLYCKNSMEERLLENKEQANNHTIVNNCKKCVVSEENSDFIIVD